MGQPHHASQCDVHVPTARSNMFCRAINLSPRTYEVVDGRLRWKLQLWTAHYPANEELVNESLQCTHLTTQTSSHPAHYFIMSTDPNSGLDTHTHTHTHTHRIFASTLSLSPLSQCMCLLYAANPLRRLVIPPESDVYEVSWANTTEVQKLRAVVGGRFDMLPLAQHGYALVFNDVGLQQGLPVNENLMSVGVQIVGTVVLAKHGLDDGEAESLPVTVTADTWKDLFIEADTEDFGDE